MFDRNYKPVGLPFEKEQILLARFLRKNFPAEVAENERKPLAESGAVELAIELLAKYKAHLTQRALDGADPCPHCCDICKHGYCSELCERCNPPRK